MESKESRMERSVITRAMFTYTIGILSLAWGVAIAILMALRDADVKAIDGQFRMMNDRLGRIEEAQSTVLRHLGDD